MSRLSIPPDSRRKNIAVNFDVVLHGPDQLCVIRSARRKDARYRLSPLCDQHALRVEVIDNTQALRLEFAGRNCLLLEIHVRILAYDQSFGQSMIGNRFGVSMVN